MLVSETVVWHQRGGRTEPLELGVPGAFALFEYARDQAAQQGLPMSDEVVRLTAGKGLAKALSHAYLASELSSLSYQIATVGPAHDAALLARSAVPGASGASPVVRALLWERVAWASARSHDHTSTRRALDAVDDAYESRSCGVIEPQWVYWLNRSEIDVIAGRCLIELGSPSAPGLVEPRKE